MMKPWYVVAMLLGSVLSVAAQQAGKSEQFVVAYEIDYQNKERYLVMSETNFNVRSKEVAAEAVLLAKAKLAARNEWSDEERARVKKLRDEKMKADAANNANNVNNANNAGANNATALAASLKGEKIKYRSFPQLDINMNPEVRSMGKFAAAAEAEERCKQLSKVLEQRNAAKEAGPKTFVRMEDKLPSLLKKHPSDGKKKDGKSGADKHEADKHADEDKAIALFEKCLGEARSAPVEDKKVVVEAATFEKGMRDTRKNVKSLGM